MTTPESSIFYGGGEMGGRMRAFPWKGTALGPVAAWPASLKALVDVVLAAKQPMYVAWGPDLIMLYNDAYRALLGSKHPAALGVAFLTVWSEVRDDLTPLVDQVFAGEPVHMDDITLMVDRGGSEREAHFAFSYTPIRDENGRVAGLLCPCSETTDQVFAARRQAFRLTLEDALRGLGSPDSIIATAVETLGNHLGASRVGYGEVQGDGRSVRLFSGYERGVVSNNGSIVDLDAFGQVAADRQRDGLTTWSADVHAEAIYDPAAFAKIDVGAFVSVPLVRDGALKAVMYVHQREARHWSPQDLILIEEVASRVWDAVERAQAEAALRESEARFSSLAQALPNQIWTSTPEGALDWFNVRTYDYSGAAPGALDGAGWASIVHPDELPHAAELWDAARESRLVYETEFRIRRFDGAFRWHLVRAVPIHGADRRVIRWVGTNTDIDDQKSAELDVLAAKDIAEAANLAKSTFIANMSHELRTPLSAIIGYSEMMAEEVEEGVDPKALADDIRKVETNARHLLGLINDVLDLSKVESGKMEIYAEDFEVTRMVGELTSTVRSLIDKNGNALDLRLAPDLGSMHSDVTKLRQILLNLLGNAAKFTERGTITLTVSRESVEGDSVMSFTVSDTGIGMTEDQVSKLFQRFTQADASTTRKFGGTGLGLSLTKAFADMLGGTIAVESAEGRGASFVVRIPVSYAPPPADEPSAITTDEAGARTSSSDLVLVIDDDPNQRLLMARFLNREGFQARTAADGHTGLALAQALRPRAILLDVMMPGVDGWSVLSMLKADPALRDIPVVMVTFVEQRALAASLGAADYVMKPVQWDRFKAVMDRYRPPEDDVLIVEDDADTRARLRTMLERDGWTVREAEHGKEGLDRLDARRPGIVLLDLTMPVMDGFAFLKAMRARADCARIPVVVLTALDLTREDRRRLHGVSQILNKGDVSLRTLGDRLHHLAQQVRLD